jgi:hypothetical protein
VIWCREARIVGPVPVERTRLRSILGRRFRYGNTHPINGARATAATDVRAAGTDVVKLRPLLHVAFVLGIGPRYAKPEYEE